MTNTTNKLPKRFVFPSSGFSQYWNYGAGKELLKKIEKIPSKESIFKMAYQLWEYDELADEVVKETYYKLGFKKANTLVNGILENGIENQKDIPDSLHQLFKETDKTPSWLDGELLDIGAKFCNRAGLRAMITLRDFSLMGGYESAAINKPLIFTGALKKGAAKRMVETVEFWIDVTGQGALQRNEVGFKSAIKVRLMHALARMGILKSGKWDSETWGIPLNHGDMVATNLGFSLVFLVGLRRLGFRPTENEVNGMFHLWKYVGFLLGIPSDYLPNNEKEAIHSLYKWTMSQSPADEDTIALAQALMNEPLNSLLLKYDWQKKFQRKMHLGYNNFFLGERACDLMGLPKTIFRFMPYAAIIGNKVKEPLISPDNYLYNRSVKKGRREQVKIKELFLKGHASSLATKDYK